ncbi:gp16 family protein [Pseudoxanthomonas sp. UTMC 1351]|uniref:gp16 family protein n=1 Tax=Pseudoxanthomonas sp. UTMC 1351 TaxID=2695853 RepID=UPI0034CDB219
MAAESDLRQQQIVRIHVAKKQLGLDEETYRSLLLRTGGEASSAKMTMAQRNAVIAEFVRLGFKDVDRQERRKRYPGRPASTDQVPMLGKVEALLTGAKRPWSYAHAMADHMFKVARVQWLNHDQLHRLVAALQTDASRKGR